MDLLLKIRIYREMFMRMQQFLCAVLDFTFVSNVTEILGACHSGVCLTS